MIKSKLELFGNFKEFHLKNPKVYHLFKRFTFEVIERGHKNFSADAISHRIRWQTSIETTDEEFKICNDHISFYSRLFMLEHPKYDGFFRTKEIHPHVNIWIAEMIYEMKNEQMKLELV